ncbi:MAG TPA: PLP-dependent aminotransferase family protein [Pseudonocardiaceae bacterium]|jgi:GntR family transcriptional regulator/MocR family aminotransferase|nr:PLP-dependent aminotransferase family protein [Pseudonocardiaceae bacterium]
MLEQPLRNSYERPLVLPEDLPLALDRQDARPLAVQLTDELRAAAGCGAVRIGDRLPSTRALATTLGVSRTVTAAAYDALQAEGWIGGRRGAGTYVIAAPGVPAPPHTGPSPVPEQQPERGIDLRPGSPWSAGLRRAAWRRAWRAAADAEVLTRSAEAGLPEFRTAVVNHLLRHRGLAVAPDAVLATGGTTAAVAELAAVLLRPGDVVAVEEPGYPRAVGALRAAGLRVLPAPVDSGGLVVTALPDHARAVYCTPAHQYPLGATLSASRRLALVAWARERRAWVLEDDYDGELRYHGVPLPLLAAVGERLRAGDVVVHLGTASKILTPTLGVGWMAAPGEVVAAVCAYRSNIGVRPSPAGQRILTALAVSGDLSRHLRRVRRELLARRDLLVGALRAAGLSVRGDQAGAHLVVDLPGEEAERSAVRRARCEGLLLDGLARCHDGPSIHYGVALGYAGLCNRSAFAVVLPELTAVLAAAQGPPGRR